MKLLIAGDIAILEKYSASLISQEVIDLFAASDLNIVNLEAPVTNSSSPILKTGPNLKSHQDSVAEVFQALNVHVATLANNHLMDYGGQGVADTLAFCKKQEVKTVGGGMNLQEASKTLYVDSPEGKIAIVNFAENEWIAATPDRAGFNPMDVIDNTKQIQEAKSNADYVIVIIHGGHEYYNLPSPRMQKQYRFYAEQGADIIVGHHTHCISGYEVHQNVPIFYSLGNFLFTKENKNEDWYSGLILEIVIENKILQTNLYPVEQSKKDYFLTLKFDSKKEGILNRLEKYNKIIAEEALLREEWEKYTNAKSDAYLSYWSPVSYINSHYLKALSNKLNLKFRNKKAFALYLNLIRCEAHSDLSKSVLKKQLKK